MEKEAYSSKSVRIPWSRSHIPLWGLCIYGCVDRFSRKMLWLVASSTDNDPLVSENCFFAVHKENKDCNCCFTNGARVGKTYFVKTSNSSLQRKRTVTSMRHQREISG